jgi:hypothetical protein
MSTIATSGLTVVAPDMLLIVGRIDIWPDDDDDDGA